MNVERFIDREKAARIKAEIRSVLMQEWDPIGVKDEPMAEEEYDGYIGGIYELIKNNASQTEISDHLRKIEVERMGFADFQVSERLDVAKALSRIDLE